MHAVRGGFPDIRCWQQGRSVNSQWFRLHQARTRTNTYTCTYFEYTSIQHVFDFISRQLLYIKHFFVMHCLIKVSTEYCDHLNKTANNWGRGEGGGRCVCVGGGGRDVGLQNIEIT